LYSLGYVILCILTGNKADRYVPDASPLPQERNQQQKQIMQTSQKEKEERGKNLLLKTIEDRQYIHQIITKY